MFSIFPCISGSCNLQWASSTSSLWLFPLACPQPPVFTKVLALILALMYSQGIHITEGALRPGPHSQYLVDDTDTSELQVDPQPPKVCVGSDLPFGVPGFNSGHDPGHCFSSLETGVDTLCTHAQIFPSLKLPLVLFYIRVVGLIVASFEAVRFVQFHSMLLWLNMLTLTLWTNALNL